MGRRHFFVLQSDFRLRLGRGNDTDTMHVPTLNGNENHYHRESRDSEKVRSGFSEFRYRM